MEHPVIDVCDNPDPADRTCILEPLLEYNRSKTPSAKLQPFAIFLRDAHNTVIGGLWGGSAYDWFFVDLLFVPEHLRGHGVGKQLMRTAEETAIARGCLGICLDSFTFQAPAFYTKLGYREVGVIPNQPKGESRIIFRKLLPPKPVPM